jgi:hypothetical protein
MHCCTEEAHSTFQCFSEWTSEWNGTCSKPEQMSHSVPFCHFSYSLEFVEKNSCSQVSLVVQTSRTNGRITKVTKGVSTPDIHHKPPSPSMPRPMPSTSTTYPFNYFPNFQHQLVAAPLTHNTHTHWPLIIIIIIKTPLPPFS